MNATQQKTYIVVHDNAELGPLTLQQLNRMRAQNQLAAEDLCRAADSADFRPLADMFPHMRQFANKTPEEHKQIARTWEGNSLANTALVCAILSFFIFGLILSLTSIGLAIKSSLRVTNFKALAAAVLGAVSFLLALYTLLKPNFEG